MTDRIDMQPEDEQDRRLAEFERAGQEREPTAAEVMAEMRGIKEMLAERYAGTRASASENTAQIPPEPEQVARRPGRRRMVLPAANAPEDAPADPAYRPPASRGWTSSEFIVTLAVIIGSFCTVNFMLYLTAQGKLQLDWQSAIAAVSPLVLSYLAATFAKSRTADKASERALKAELGAP